MEKTTEMQIKNLNKDINSTLHELAALKKKPETETTFFKREDLEKSLAQCYHRKLQLIYPKAESLYLSCITEVIPVKGINLMIRHHLIETCGVSQVDGEKIYAI